MAQTWHDLLFAHWPVPVEGLRRLIPASLEPDTYAGEAWVGVVPFRMTGIRLRGLPALPGLSALPELNLRTYVVAGDKPGVLFFSLDAGNPIAVAVARTWYHLPYYRARMSAQPDGEGVRFASRRTHWGARQADFRARYGPVGPVLRSEPGSLEHWLTERYCLYAPTPGGRVYRADIHHSPWPLQLAKAEIPTNTLPRAHGLELPDTPPLLHFARRLDVLAWTPERL
jgi:uncharacterized protein YqjF (DUF2071 family)